MNGEIRLGEFDKWGYKNSFSKGELARELVYMNRDYKQLQQERDKYKSIVDKAIKYIEENTETNYLEYYSGYKNVIESENILGILKELEEGNSNE